MTEITETGGEKSLLTMASTAIKAQDFAAAQTLLTRLLGEQPNEPRAYLAMSLVELGQDNPKAALPWLKQAEILEPNHAASLIHQANALLILRQTKAAQDVLEHAVVINSKDI